MKILNLFTVTLMVVVVSYYAQAGGKAVYPVTSQCHTATGYG